MAKMFMVFLLGVLTGLVIAMVSAVLIIEREVKNENSGV